MTLKNKILAKKNAVDVNNNQSIGTVTCKDNLATEKVPRYEYNRGFVQVPRPILAASPPLFIHQKELEIHWQGTIKTCPSKSAYR